MSGQLCSGPGVFSSCSDIKGNFLRHFTNKELLFERFIAVISLVIVL